MIFLSASIPYIDNLKDEKYYFSADVIAIRDSVRALAKVAIPKSTLVWGGHPAITPLIRLALQTMDKNVNEHVTLYQSSFFENNFPEENDTFEKIIYTAAGKDKESSVNGMRNIMFSENKFKVGIFIGGMDGVEKEYELFKIHNPNSLILPVASTGAAAKIIYEKAEFEFDERLLTDYSYMNLFKSLLTNYL